MTANTVDVLNLCVQFKENAEEIVQKNPDLHSKAVAAVTPHMEEVQEIMGDILETSMEAAFSDPEALLEDEDFQNQNFRLLEIFAQTAPQILDEEQVWNSIPDALQNNQEAAELLENKGATSMAKLCMNAPKK